RQDIIAALAEGSARPTVTDFLLKAIALALTTVPEANIAWADDELLVHASTDVALAVAVPDGLFTPVVRDAAAKSLSAVARETRELARQAREGALLPQATHGGSATLSNLGM